MNEQQQQLVTQNLRLVHSLAHRYAHRGIEYEELYSAGCEGLCKAARRFEPQRGLCFSTYAVPVILGQLRQLFRDSGSVSVSRSVRELQQLLRRLTDRLRESGTEPTVSQLADAAGVSCEQAALALCSAGPTLSLDGDDAQAVLSTPDDACDTEERISLTAQLQRLPDKERKLIRLRYFSGKTQQQTAALLGMTQVQVSRAERRILQRLREQLDVTA